MIRLYFVRNSLSQRDAIFDYWSMVTHGPKQRITGHTYTLAA